MLQRLFKFNSEIRHYEGRCGIPSVRTFGFRSQSKSLNVIEQFRFFRKNFGEKSLRTRSSSKLKLRLTSAASRAARLAYTKNASRSSTATVRTACSIARRRACDPRDERLGSWRTASRAAAFSIRAATVSLNCGGHEGKWRTHLLCLSMHDLPALSRYHER